MAHGNLGNALDWAGNWRSQGGFVNAVPAVGTIACFQPGADGADVGSGHVAVVVRIQDASSFIVTEMHAPTLGVVDTRRCPLVAGIAFLHEFPPPPPEADDLTSAQAQMLADIHNALFGPTAPSGTVPWNNVEIIRRQNVQLGADYDLHPGPVPPPKAGTP